MLIQLSQTFQRQTGQSIACGRSLGKANLICKQAHDRPAGQQINCKLLLLLNLSSKRSPAGCRRLRARAGDQLAGSLCFRCSRESRPVGGRSEFRWAQLQLELRLTREWWTRSSISAQQARESSNSTQAGRQASKPSSCARSLARSLIQTHAHAQSECETTPTMNWTQRKVNDI